MGSQRWATGRGGGGTNGAKGDGGHLESLSQRSYPAKKTKNKKKTAKKIRKQRNQRKQGVRASHHNVLLELLNLMGGRTDAMIKRKKKESAEKRKWGDQFDKRAAGSLCNNCR